MIKIILDAGHGLYTPGKRCLKSLDPKQTREWTLNNRIANHVENLLKGYEGAQVLRVDDKTGKRDIPLSERTRKANNWKADIYISIHHDAGANGGSGGGVTAYRYPNSSKMTRAMLQNLYNSIVKHNKLKGNRSSPLNEANFAVLRQTNMAAALIENGFMDSRTDVPIILSDAHAKKTAEGIVEFVVNHYRLRPRIKETNTNEPTTSNDELYKVQAGAYSKKENADKKLKELKNKGIDGYIKKE